MNYLLFLIPAKNSESGFAAVVDQSQEPEIFSKS